MRLGSSDKFGVRDGRVHGRREVANVLPTRSWTPRLIGLRRADGGIIAHPKVAGAARRAHMELHAPSKRGQPLGADPLALHPLRAKRPEARLIKRSLRPPCRECALRAGHLKFINSPFYERKFRILVCVPETAPVRLILVSQPRAPLMRETGTPAQRSAAQRARAVSARVVSRWVG